MLLAFWSVKFLLEDILLYLLLVVCIKCGVISVVCNYMFGWHKTYVPSSGAGCFPVCECVCQEENDNKCAHTKRNQPFCHISLKVFPFLIRFIDLFICFYRCICVAGHCCM